MCDREPNSGGWCSIENVGRVDRTDETAGRDWLIYGGEEKTVAMKAGL